MRGGGPPYTAKEMSDEDDQHPLIGVCVESVEGVRCSGGVEHREMSNVVHVAGRWQFVGHLEVSTEVARGASGLYRGDGHVAASVNMIDGLSLTQCV